MHLLILNLLLLPLLSLTTFNVVFAVFCFTDHQHLGIDVFLKVKITIFNKRNVKSCLFLKKLCIM